MAEVTRTDRLVVWSLATFHTGLFMLVLVLLLHWGGALGGLLSTLNTLVGMAVYGLLWATNWWCTRRAMRTIGWWGIQRPIDTDRLLSQGMMWGGVNGMLFLLGLLIPYLVLSLVFIAVSPHDVRDPLLVGAQYVMLILSGVAGAIVLCAFAFPIGAVFGLVFAIIDRVMLAIARNLFLGCLASMSASTQT